MSTKQFSAAHIRIFTCLLISQCQDCNHIELLGTLVFLFFCNRKWIVDTRLTHPSSPPGFFQSSSSWKLYEYGKSLLLLLLWAAGCNCRWSYDAGQEGVCYYPSNAAASAGWDLQLKSVIPGVDDQVYKQAIKVGWLVSNQNLVHKVLDNILHLRS
jgi:hypothetical protein